MMKIHSMRALIIFFLCMHCIYAHGIPSAFYTLGDEEAAAYKPDGDTKHFLMEFLVWDRTYSIGGLERIIDAPLHFYNVTKGLTSITQINLGLYVNEERYNVNYENDRVSMVDKGSDYIEYSYSEGGRRTDIVYVTKALLPIGRARHTIIIQTNNKIIISDAPKNEGDEQYAEVYWFNESGAVYYKAILSSEEGIKFGVGVIYEDGVPYKRENSYGDLEHYYKYDDDKLTKIEIHSYETPDSETPMNTNEVCLYYSNDTVIQRSPMEETVSFYTFSDAGKLLKMKWIDQRIDQTNTHIFSYSDE